MKNQFNQTELTFAINIVGKCLREGDTLSLMALRNLMMKQTGPNIPKKAKEAAIYIIDEYMATDDYKIQHRVETLALKETA